MRTLLSCLALCLCASLAFAGESILLENATVYTDAYRKQEKTSVLIKDGLISAIGNNLQVPADAKKIDASGKLITAGLVDSLSNVGLTEVTQIDESNEGRFQANTIHAAYKVWEGYNTMSMVIPIVRAAGITSVIAAPQGGLIAGVSAWMSLAANVNPVPNTVVPSLAMHGAIGGSALSSAEGSRGLTLTLLRELLEDAKQLAARKDAFEKNQTREFAADKKELEALQPVLQGTLPLVLEAHKSTDILGALRVAAEYKLRLVIVGGTEAWMVAKELAAAKVPVILNPADNLPFSFDQLYVRDDNAALLAAAGVQMAFSRLGEAGYARQLRQQAGIAVSRGLAWEAAFAAITSTPAEIFGVKQRGRIEVGYAADLVVWSGDPLELSSKALHVFCNGVEQSLENHQTKLAKKYLKVPAQ